MVSKYPINNGILTTGTFTDSDGVVFDPTAVKVDVVQPDGTTTTVTHPNAVTAKLSTGVYTHTLANANVAGVWKVIFYCDTTEIVKDEHKFIITPIPS